MSYGVEIFNESGQTRLGVDTSTLVLVASGSATYAGTTVVNVTVPAISGSGTSYAIRTGGSENGLAGEVVKLSMSTQTNLRIEWFAGATSFDYISYAVYHR